MIGKMNIFMISAIRRKMRDYKNLKTEPINENGIDPPDTIPEVTYIYVTPEKYKEMMAGCGFTSSKPVEQPSQSPDSL